MIKNKIFFDTIVIVFFSNLANLISMVVQIILGKKLSYYDFSIYYSLIALISFLIMPASTIGIFLQSKFSRIINQNGNISVLFLHSTKKIFYYFLMIFLIFLIFYKTLKINFDHENFYTFFNFFIVLVLLIYMNWPLSLNLAYKNYKINSILYFLASILKLILIILFFYIFDYSNLLSAININLFFTLLLTLLYFLPNLKRIQIRKIIKKNDKILSGDLKFYVFHSLMLPIMFSTDIILAKVYFSSEASAKYIVASSLSKIIYFITAGLYSMFFNESLNSSKKNTAHIIIIILITSFFTTFSLIYFGKNIIEIIYGKKFDGSYEYLSFLCMSVYIVCLSKIMCDILISKEKYGFIKLQFASYVLLAYLIIFQFEELADLPKYMLYSSSCLFVLIFLNFIKNFKYFTKKFL
jgi:O-antigen/teichoic acid export membrane protein